MWRRLAAAWALLALVGVVADVVDVERVTIALTADATSHRVERDEWTTSSTAGDHVSIHTSDNASVYDAGDSPRVFLAVGVKTNVLRGAASREAIRATWGTALSARSLGVRLWFVGCSPDLSGLSDAERVSAVETVALEKATYHDLLTDELRCKDSIANGLVAKTIEFMSFADAAHRSPTAPAYVLMVNDDVYVRLDRLVELLQSDALPRERLYAGNAATVAQRVPNPPERDPQSRFYIPHDLYPMTELPPFVAGAHYILSRDMVEFVARNRDDLEGLVGLDDVTMALWMLALQVHPTFLDTFQILKYAPCTEDLVSYAGLSPAGVHHIHTNLMGGHAMCAGFSSKIWSSIELGGSSEPRAFDTENSVQFEWDLQHDPASYALHIQVDCVVGTGRVSITYVPSTGTYDSLFCGQLLEIVRRRLGLAPSPTFCARHRQLLQAYLTEEYMKNPALRAKVEIARHNLARSQADEASGVASPLWTVVLSPESTYARVMVECLFSQLRPTHRVVVLNEADVMPHSPPPDVFMFSVLDNGMRTASDSPHSYLPPPGATYFLNKYGRSSHVVMISGESWHPQHLPPQVILLSTARTPYHPKHVYLPYASAAFGEMVRNAPTSLLQPRLATDDTSERRFCAYMYSNCGIGFREYMFDLLNAIDPVDALGYCQGASRSPEESRLVGRRSMFYADDAVDQYRNYKFVIAFENKLTVPGYVTEKIVTAFLAGAVPIYYGHSESVLHLFDEKSFINCGAFQTLQACANRVQQIHNSPSEYAAFRAAAPVTNRTAFVEFFSWHPEVAQMVASHTHSPPGSVVTQLEALFDAKLS